MFIFGSRFAGRNPETRAGTDVNALVCASVPGLGTFLFDTFFSKSTDFGDQFNVRA
jgi:hypothetical protein